MLVPGLLPRTQYHISVEDVWVKQETFTLSVFRQEILINVAFIYVKITFVHVAGGKVVFKRLTGEKVDWCLYFTPTACAPFNLTEECRGHHLVSRESLSLNILRRS